MASSLQTVLPDSPAPPAAPKASGRPKVFFENLDGLRFFCFLAVFLFHSFHTDYDALRDTPIYQFIKRDVFGNGNLGVNFFFVLSGFLITYLLIIEKDTIGKIDVKNFWMRRILRIWPLYYFCVFFGFVIFPQLKLFFGQTPNETAHPIYYLTFLNNFDFINTGLPDSSVLGVLWSIAIEEQFYLVWPLLLGLLPVRGYPYFFVLTIAGTILFRSMVYQLPNHHVILEHHTFSCIGDMTMGALGAYLVLKGRLREWVERVPKAGVLLLYLVFAALFFFRDEFFYHDNFLRVIERPVMAVVMLCIILEQNYARHSLFKMSQFPRISRLGQITYGLYCLHFIGILITTTITRRLHFNTELWQVFIVDTTVALTLTILIAKVSYKYFEKPFLKIKDRFAHVKTTEACAP